MTYIVVSMELELATIDNRCFDFDYLGLNMCDEQFIRENLKEKYNPDEVLFI